MNMKNLIVLFIIAVFGAGFWALNRLVKAIKDARKMAKGEEER